MKAPGRIKIGWTTAAAIVIANMVGTGVFTTLGFQLVHLDQIWSILLLWVIGGVVALTGAFTYAEIATRLPKSGGEYHFLSHIFHPFLGYLSGWVSITVGFAAAIALAAMAIGSYVAEFLGQDRILVAMMSILVVALVHSFDVKQSSRFQNVLTGLKVLLVLVLIICGLFLPAAPGNALHTVVAATPGWSVLWQPAYAVSLVYVIYAFSGWNAAAYITDEIEEPHRNLPRALVGGTVLVCVLFFLLQVAFLRQAPAALLQGRVEVGLVVAQLMFGARGGEIVSFLIAGLLIAGISAMIWVGSRVTRAMAADYQMWQYFTRDNKRGVPVRAVWLQAGISVFLVTTSSFEQVLLYSGFVLQLFTILTVVGLFRLRLQHTGDEQAWHSPLFPLVPLVFLLFNSLILGFLLLDKPYESVLGLLNLAAGALSYAWEKWRYQPAAEPDAKG
ncbi:MAG: amino acid permease [Bacteroidetes bacterium]|nr:MAG: amino acid permease [Bacteroidota bacterium]PTM11499.1 MAG: amino acid permease [Bacteroidota bacterium]